MVVLVANDHLLKGSPFAPAWLTGKASDFAGLIVAPVLLAVVTRAYSPGRRMLCFGIVAMTFAAVKLSTTAAEVLADAVGLLGIRWRIWSDPSDLVALVVLPAVWRIARGVARGLPSSARPWPERAAVIVGAVACLATSRAAPVGIETSIYFVNTTRDPVTVHLYRVIGPLDCASIVDTRPPTLVAAEFTSESCTTLAPFDVLPLGRNWRRLSADAGSKPVDAGSEPVCDAVVVRAPGLDDTALFWNGVARTFVSLPTTQGLEVDKADPHAIYLEQAGARLFAGGTDLVQAWTGDFAGLATDCPVKP